MADESDWIDLDGDGDGSDGRVLDWEVGLQSADDLTPLSQLLVPPELASAFSISPEPFRSILDVHRASQSTLSSLRRHNSAPPATDLRSISPEDPMVFEDDYGSPAEPALKRQRLVWTPQLHRRFVEVVAHLGIKNAVPKTIMKLMNVEGLTRENVASHLQKYRLYLKRMPGLSNEGPSSSDPLFASTPVPQSLQENPMPAQQQKQQMQPMVMPMHYAVPTMIPMPMYGLQQHNRGIGMVPMSNGYHRYDNNQQQHPFGGFGEQRSKDWANGSQFGNGVVSYPAPVTPNDK